MLTAIAIAFFLCGFTFWVTNRMNHTRYTRQLVEQSHQCSFFLEEVVKIREELLLLERGFFKIRQKGREQLLAEQEKLVSETKQLSERFRHADDAMALVYDNSGFESTPEIRDELCSNFDDFFSSARKTRHSHEAFIRSWDATIARLLRQVRILKRRTAGDIENYLKMLTEMQAFVAMPVHLDFDPNPDFERVEKNLAEKKALQKKLLEIDGALAEIRMKPWTMDPEANPGIRTAAKK